MRRGLAYEKTTPSGKESPALSSVMLKSEVKQLMTSKAQDENLDQTDRGMGGFVEITNYMRCQRGLQARESSVLYMTNFVGHISRVQSTPPDSFSNPPTPPYFLETVGRQR